MNIKIFSQVTAGALAMLMTVTLFQATQISEEQAVIAQAFTGNTGEAWDADASTPPIPASYGVSGFVPQGEATNYIQAAAATLPPHTRTDWTDCPGNGPCSAGKILSTSSHVTTCRAVLSYNGGHQVVNAGRGNASGMVQWFYNRGFNPNEIGDFLLGGAAAYSMVWHLNINPQNPASYGSFRYQPCLNHTYTAYGTANANLTCPVDNSRNFPYPIGVYWLIYEREVGHGGSDDFGNHYDAAWDREFRNGTPTCVYARNEVPVPEIYSATMSQVCQWNVRYSAHSAGTKAAITSGGTPQEVRNPSPELYPQPSVDRSSKIPVLNNCRSGLNWNMQTRTPYYSYYRMTSTVDQQRFNFFIWSPAWTSGSQITSRIVEEPVRTDLAYNAYGVYSCSVGGGEFRFVGVNHGALPNSIALDSSQCRETPGNPQWECDITPNPNIGNTGSVNNPAYVMRDGRNNSLTLPQVTLSGAARDPITQTSLISGDNASYRVNVPTDASPRLSADNNATKQYFKMKRADGQTKENFGVWQSDPNGNRDKFMSYYWSSNQNSHWNLTYEARLNQGEYLVPVIGWSNEAPTYEWVLGAHGACSAPGDRTQTVIPSNNVFVERSVQSG